MMTDCDIAAATPLPCGSRTALCWATAWKTAAYIWPVRQLTIRLCVSMARLLPMSMLGVKHVAGRMLQLLSIIEVLAGERRALSFISIFPVHGCGVRHAKLTSKTANSI